MPSPTRLLPALIRAASRIRRSRGHSLGLAPCLLSGSLLAGCLLAAGCSSPGASRAEVAREGGLVALTLPGQTLTILSDAYLQRSGVPGDTPQDRRNAFYSVARRNALVKVASDERFGDLVRALEASGFSRYAVEGEFAGAGAASAPNSAITLVVGDDARHAVKPVAATADSLAALDKKELESFTNMKGAIVIVYNEIRAFQNVDAEDFEFEQPELAPNLRRFVEPLQR